MEEFRKRMGLDYRTVVRWIEKGKIKGTIKPGKERFIAISEIERIQNGR